MLRVKMGHGQEKAAVAGDPARKIEHPLAVGRPKPAIDDQRGVIAQDDADVRHQPDPVVADHPHPFGDLLQVVCIHSGGP